MDEHDGFVRRIEKVDGFVLHRVVLDKDFINITPPYEGFKR